MLERLLDDRSRIVQANALDGIVHLADDDSETSASTRSAARVSCPARLRRPKADRTSALQRSIDLLTDTLLSHLAYEERELLHPLAQYGLN